MKISSVVSDTFGVSASRMIEAIMAGTLDTEAISDLAVGKLKSKKEELKKALVGNFHEHHRFMIKASLDHIESLEKIIVEDKIVKSHIKRLKDLGDVVELKKVA